MSWIDQIAYMTSNFTLCTKWKIPSFLFTLGIYIKAFPGFTLERLMYFRLAAVCLFKFYRNWTRKIKKQGLSIWLRGVLHASLDFLIAIKGIIRLFLMLASLFLLMYSGARKITNSLFCTPSAKLRKTLVLSTFQNRYTFSSF